MQRTEKRTRKNVDSKNLEDPKMTEVYSQRSGKISQSDEGNKYTAMMQMLQKRLRMLPEVNC